MQPLDNNARISTKIIATLGPATVEPSHLAAVLEAGVDACRLNFSYGRLEDHKRNLTAVCTTVLDTQLCEPGPASPADLIVVVTSTQRQTRGGTDTVLAHRVGQ
jgi:hypothetical protein